VRFLEGAILFVSALLIAGCSSAVNTSSPAQPAAAPGAAATQAWLDLCSLPDLAPTDLRSKTDYMQWAVSVTDASGAPITGLKSSDFLARSGSNSYPISWFRETASPATPISLVLLVDVSASMWNKTVVPSQGLAQVRAKLEHAFAEMNDCDEIGVVIAGGKHAPGFDPAQFGLPTPLAEVTLIQPFTTDHEEAMLKMYSLAPAGPSKLADGLRMALSQLGQAHYPNRALVVLTDALDQAAIDEAVPLLEQARASGIPLWVIGMGDPDAKTGALSSLAGTYRVDAAGVERLAATGGGRPLFALPLDKDVGVSLAQAIGVIVKELGQGYTIGVIAPPGGTPAITLAKPSNATVRAGPVPSQVLADAAARPTPTQVQCAADDWPPAAVSSNAGFTLVRVLVTGPDKRAVSGLKSAAFVASTGTDVYPLVYFHENQGDSPKAIVIAIDTSGSMDLKLQTIRSEIGKFLGQLNPCDQVALVAFSDRTFLLENLTTNHKTVEHLLAFLHAYGRTAIYDAVNQSMETLSKAQYHDRTLVLVTDGMDNASQTSRDALLATVAHNQVPIYAIGIGDPNLIPDPLTSFMGAGEGENAVDAPTLAALASVTGGKHFIVPTMDRDQGVGFAAALHDVADQLDNGYEVGFIEGIPGSTPVISVPRHPDYVVKIIGVPAPAN
jgi:Ca-activated chloride channel homolog